MHIKIYDGQDFDPETLAMLQAFYSRSPKSIESRVAELDSDPRPLMKRFYVNYGHRSIGDCGSTTIFIENVSMLAAKAIQDWPLYSGQEGSTRYMDFSEGLGNPPQSGAQRDIQQGWFKLYSYYLPKIKEVLTYNNPYKGDMNGLNEYTRSISARAFDICRSLLPCGAATQLSWTTNLRQANDHLMELRSHPLLEVRIIASTIFYQLADKYPHSFSKEYYEGTSFSSGSFKEVSSVAQRHYHNTYARKVFYGDHHPVYKYKNMMGFDSLNVVRLLDIEGLRRNEKYLMEDRPHGTELPRYLDKYGSLDFKFLLDFGSFRDLQRHRNGLVIMPVVTTRYGMHPWYMNQIHDLLGADEHTRLIKQSESLFKQAGELVLSDIDRQYFLPMGLGVQCNVVWTLPQAVYVTELRSGRAVHPTLRKVAHRIGDFFKKEIPELKLYLDDEPDGFQKVRGKQTITTIL